MPKTINADKIAAKPAHAPALRRPFPIAQRLADNPAHILEFQLRQRPFDRKPQVPPMPANAGATHSPRQRRLRTFRNLKQRASPVTPPRRHDPHHHVLPPDNARNHPSIAIVLKRVVLLFWRPLAHRPLARRRLGPLNPFASSSAMRARTPNPLFVSGPPSTPALRLAVRTTDGRRGCLAPHRIAVLLPFSQPRPDADRSRRGRRPLPRQTPPRARNFDADRLPLQRFAPTPRSSLLGGSRPSSNGDVERRADLIPSLHAP